MQYGGGVNSSNLGFAVEKMLLPAENTRRNGSQEITLKNKNCNI